MPLVHALAEAQNTAEARLRLALKGTTGTIREAMIYAVRGGKGLRAFLVLEGAKLHGLPPSKVGSAAAAIESIHAYSLVHDDLPCMDDDVLRRGRPTVHKAWDEATAVLVGDALQSLAFELVIDVAAPDAARLELSQTLARAAGVRGMVGGQAMDIAAESADEPLDLARIVALQKGKTGALIEWSAMAGPRMAGADTAPMQAYGAALGLAFQIWDDVLDVEGDAADLGKAVGKDADRGKATFVSLLGLDGAKGRAKDLVTEACDALSVYGQDAAILKDAAQFVIARSH